MRVIVTRPATQALEWTHELQRCGIDAAALPLIGIEPVDDAAPLREVWATLARHQLLVFVSPNAVEHLFAQRPPASSWPASTWAASPGPGTTRALLSLGVPVARIIEPAADAPQFDSEALWLQLGGHDWQGASVLIVRGEQGRDWLAGKLRGGGAQVETIAAYRRTPPEFGSAENKLLQAAIESPQRHLWFFSSSEAVDNLVQVSPPGAWRSAAALATHPRIAERARHSGFGRVIEARAALDDVVACIQSIGP